MHSQSVDDGGVHLPKERHVHTDHVLRPKATGSVHNASNLIYMTTCGSLGRICSTSRALYSKTARLMRMLILVNQHPLNNVAGRNNHTLADQELSHNRLIITPCLRGHGSKIRGIWLVEGVTHATLLGNMSEAIVIESLQETQPMCMRSESCMLPT